MHIPVCIFITLYLDYVPEGFELAALDFLLKQVAFDRFEKAAERAKNTWILNIKLTFWTSAWVRTRSILRMGKHIKLSVPQIIYLEALKDYTIIATIDNQYKVLSSVGSPAQ